MTTEIWSKQNAPPRPNKIYNSVFTFKVTLIIGSKVADNIVAYYADIRSYTQAGVLILALAVGVGTKKKTN